MSHTLLLADDSVTIRRVVELTFAGHDIRVVAVDDGQEALERMRTVRPDIVLADIGMPRVDGYAVARHMRGDPRLQGVPVLLLAGAFDPVDQARVEEAGARGVLVKPFEPTAVIRRVRELLGMHGEADPPGPRAATPAPAVGPRREATERPAASAPPATLPRAPNARESMWDALRHRSGLEPDAPSVEGAADERDYLEALEDAFDSLDAQLAGRSSRPVGPPHARSRFAEADEDVFTADRVSAPGSGPGDADRESDDWLAASAMLEANRRDEAPSGAAPGEVAETQPLPRAAETADPAPAEPPAPEDAPPDIGAGAVAAGVAEAFETLLAQEQGELPAAAVSFAPPVAPGKAAGVELTDVLIDQMAARVAARLADGLLRDVVAEVVGEVAERLVREEIDRIRRGPKGSG